MECVASTGIASSCISATWVECGIRIFEREMLGNAK
jgi:hypothetical protein